MARNRGKKALYEVMSKARAKQGYGQTLDLMHPKKTEEVKPAAAQPKPVSQPAKKPADWWKRPRIAQFNAGRFEFSVPYQVAIALGLVLILLLLGSYRLGQNSVVRGQLPVGESSQDVKQADQQNRSEPATAGIEEPSSLGEPAPPSRDVPDEDTTPVVEEKEVEPVTPKGKYAIVLAHSGRIVDLQPVVEFFAVKDIELRIVPLKNGQYQLQTVEHFASDPATPGTEGFKLKSEIIRVGPLYEGKAPAGLDTFAPHYFTDAYGKNVED